MRHLVLRASALLALCLLNGCVIVRSDAPSLTTFMGSGNVSVAVDGFVSEAIDVNPIYGSSSTFHSGGGIVSGQSFSYSGSSATSLSGFNITHRETSVMCGEVRNMLADMGVPVLSPDPAYIVTGTYRGPSTDWSRWYADAAVDIFSLTLCWNVRTKAGCDIRVFDCSSGRLVKLIKADDSYQFTSFSLLPLYGHMFVPEMWPNNLYPICIRRVTVKAVNELAEWLTSQENVKTKPLPYPDEKQLR